MIRFLALGPPELHGTNSAELRGVLTQPRLLALLSYLAIDRPAGFRRRDSLVALLWPELGHQSARNALRQVVHRLRRALGESVIASRGAEELAIADGQLWCDVAAFEDALDAGKVQEALALYRGDLLPGFFTSDAPDFERWLDDERARLRRRAASAAWQLVDQQSAEGGVDSALHWARWAAALIPDDEAASRKLIELQLRVGDRAGALRSHEALTRRLADDFETTPSPETQAVIQSMHDASITVRPREQHVAAVVVAAPALPRPAVSPAVPRRWIPTGIAAGVLLVVALLATFGGDRRAAADPPRTVAVFPFAIRGSNDFAYLREGMVDLISAKMEGAAGFHAVDPRSVIAAMTRARDTVDLTGSAAIARQLGANWLIRGEVLEIAGRLHLSGTVYDISRDPRGVLTASVSGEGTALFQLVDDLVGRMLATVAPGRDTAVTTLAAQTTHSLPALKAFLQGEQALRSGREAEAAAAFRDATALDTTFALAQYRLALAATWAPVAEVPIPSVPARIAARHRSRLSPLGRDLVMAHLAYREFRTDSATALYREITRGHPDNLEAWLMLGETYFHLNTLVGRSPSESREPFERVLRLDPRNAHALLHLTRLAALEGRRDELDSLVRAYATWHKNADRLLEVRALQASLKRDARAISIVAQQGRDANDFSKLSLLLDAITYAQNFDAAGELIATALTVQNTMVSRFRGRLLADLPFAKGAWTGAASASRFLLPDERDWTLETEALLAAEPFFGASRARLLQLRDSIAARRAYPLLRMQHFPPQSSGELMRHYLLGLLSVRLGDSAAAARYHAALAETRGDDGEIGRALARGVRAQVLRSAGDLNGALAELESFPYDLSAGINRVGHWANHERFLRAELLVALGRDREALPSYDSAIHAYVPWIPASHLRRGEIQERLGNPERAQFHYDRARDMWRDADEQSTSFLRRAQEGYQRVTTVRTTRR